MDAFTRHLGGLQRRFPGPPTLAHIGWVPRKRDRIRHTFLTCNFSIVLSGGGSYLSHGRVLPVAGPMVLTQWPQEPMDYGPDNIWAELYLIYGPEQEDRLRRSGLLSVQRPCWRVQEARRLRLLVDELSDLVKDDAAAHIDRIDRLAETAIVESLLGAAEASVPGPLAAIDELRRRIEAEPSAPIDLVAAARNQGLSPTHFRRLWAERVGGTPARHAMQQRLRAAARWLAEGDAAVGDIAARAGFADPLHFSRRFRAAFGVPPSAYRERWEKARLGA